MPLPTDQSGKIKRGPGRPKGSLNKATREWKDFVTALARDVNAQERLKEHCLERPELLLKVAEHAVGKPKETVELRGEFKMIEWPTDKDIAEE